MGRQAWSGAKEGFSKGMCIGRGGQSLLLASEIKFANILELVWSHFSYDQDRENMDKMECDEPGMKVQASSSRAGGHGNALLIV